MTQKEILHIVKTQLTIDLNCSVEDLDGEKDSFVFTKAIENPGRRPFPRCSSHFEMLSMGNAIIVSATKDILPIVTQQMAGKDRDEAFSLPFVYGHSLYYLPDLNNTTPMNAPDGFTYELIENECIHGLYQHEGFEYAIQYDINHPRPDVLATVARYNDKIVGIAGASNDCAKMWQVGMNVLPEYRRYGLGAYLVNWLTLEILKRDYIPYYGTASSNIASQRVAHRAGYMPAWICAYKGKFDNLITGYLETLPTS